MTNRWAGIGALVMALGVMAGAFGAHGLKSSVSPDLMIIFEKGVFYHLVHGLAIIITSLMAPTSLIDQRKSARVCSLFLFGIVVFSGSLYTLAISGQRWLGAITPLGGISFIAAWIILGAALVGTRRDDVI
jgi:uncharacterized membrane protein YgdD (TMEM256/DUF423 family)